MWIEIRKAGADNNIDVSHTARAVCGLKSLYYKTPYDVPESYRASGAWIEILRDRG